MSNSGPPCCPYPRITCEDFLGMREKKQVATNDQRPELPVRRKRGAKPSPRNEDRPRVPLGTPASHAIGRAYERLLELPVLVILVVLWLLGALILGAVAVVAYSASVWLWT